MLDKETLEQQQQLAALLEASIGGMAGTMRRQQRQRVRRLADGSSPAQALVQLQAQQRDLRRASTDDTAAAGDQGGVSSARASPRSSITSGGRRSRRSSMRELFELAAQVVVGFPSGPRVQRWPSAGPPPQPSTAAAAAAAVQRSRSAASLPAPDAGSSSGGGVQRRASGASSSGADGDVELGRV